MVGTLVSGWVNLSSDFCRASLERIREVIVPAALTREPPTDLFVGTSSKGIFRSDRALEHERDRLRILLVEFGRLSLISWLEGRWPSRG